MAKTRCTVCSRVIEAKEYCPECGASLRYPRTMWEEVAGEE